MANSKRERKYQKRFGEKLLEEHGIWSYIIPDTPTLSEGGITRTTNEFDTIIACKVIAVEFKFMDGGLSFNLGRWKDDDDTAHQYRDLMRFYFTKSGCAVFVIFWKPNGKRDVQLRWEYVQNLPEDKIYLDDMRGEGELIRLIKEMNR